MNLKLINTKVRSILRSFEPLAFPIDIEFIAKSRGLKVVPYPLDDDVSGVLAIEGGQGTIGYNQKEPRTRKRFTIAHELGHFELHRQYSNLFVDKQFIYRSQTSGDTKEKLVMEQEANLFASMILMPSDVLRREVEKMEIDLGNEDGLRYLSKAFDVSISAMSVRISSLGLF